MTVKRVWWAFVLGAAVAACQKDTAGVLQTTPPLAGLRYFDAVPDTGYMDFRLVDIFDYAPNTQGASFRTGGNPMGVPTSYAPPYLSVRTGTHQIRAFLDSTDLATATTIMFDTTMTFLEGHNYTFILYGSARAGALHALVLDDSAMALPADDAIWVRTVNLAADSTGLGASVDAFIIPQANSPAAPPTISASTYVNASAYVRVPTGSLKAVLTRTGDATLTPTVTANLPAGVVGTATVNPIAGSLVKNTAITVLILPRSTPGAGMPATFAAPGVVFLIDQQPPLTAP
jgi:hypothetical protein